MSLQVLIFFLRKTHLHYSIFKSAYDYYIEIIEFLREFYQVPRCISNILQSFICEFELLAIYKIKYTLHKVNMTK